MILAESSGGFFVLSAGARERTRGCSPRAVWAEPAGVFSALSVGEVFCVVSMGVREHTYGCSPRVVRAEPFGGVVLAGVRVFSLRRNFV